MERGGRAGGGARVHGQAGCARMVQAQAPPRRVQVPAAALAPGSGREDLEGVPDAEGHVARQVSARIAQENRWTWQDGERLSGRAARLWAQDECIRAPQGK